MKTLGYRKNFRTWCKRYRNTCTWRARSPKNGEERLWKAGVWYVPVRSPGFEPWICYSAVRCSFSWDVSTEERHSFSTVVDSTRGYDLVALDQVAVRLVSCVWVMMDPWRGCVRRRRGSHWEVYHTSFWLCQKYKLKTCEIVKISTWASCQLQYLIYVVCIEELTLANIASQVLFELNAPLHAYFSILYEESSEEAGKP